MKDLVVKKVDLMGDNVMAAKDNDGVIWAGINYFCNALGMSKGQRDKQVQKVKTDEVLKLGCSRLEAGVFDSSNETYAIRLDYIPMWLAKIQITSKTKKEHPELAEKLLNYQLKAKDILAEAFMPKQSFPQTIPEQIQLLAQGNVQLTQRVDDLQSDIEALKMDLPLLPVEADEINSKLKQKGTDILGGKQSNAYNDRSLRQKLYINIHSNLRYNFGVNTYKAIKRSQLKQALEVVSKYEPPVFLQEQIDGMNAQQRFQF